MTADIDSAATAAQSPSTPPSRRGAAANGSHPTDLHELQQAMEAMRAGDFSVRLPAGRDGPLGRIAVLFNEIVGANQNMAQQLERIGKSVGEQGRTRQRVKFGISTATWGEMEGSVNGLIDDLVWPTTEVTRVIGAVAQGDLLQTVRLDVDGRPLKGEFLRAATIVNTMIKQLSVFTSEVTRVAREVGTEGKLGGQAKVSEVTGVWRELTESVNSMANNLTAQMRNISDVTIAVANGDLSRKITVDVRGEILQLKEAINTMVDQLRSFASEVTRVAREVGTEGKLGGQAIVPGVAGTWKDLTDSVNAMCGNLTDQVRNIADVTTAVARGDLSKKITVNVSGEILQLKDTINTMVDQLNGFAGEVTRVAREVGTEGKLGGQAQVPGVAGTWKDLTDNVNSMATNLTGQVRNIAEVTTAVAGGDLSKKITVDVRGEILQLKETINTMVDQLNGFAGEVTRVAREVGTEGKLGGQAQVPGVAGVWKDLTDNVNLLAANLTTQVRNIAEVTTAVAGGDLSKKITVDASGEILRLKETINTMVDQLNGFAGEVTRVAREVGTEGKLGGQAQVPGVAGTWKDLTDNVNSMATNLTSQVRNIAEVTTAVARGDLSKKITVDVRGEILQLKETINTMVDQLNGFAGEVTRVAREVGTEGKLGGQAQVPGVDGTWKDLTDNVNLLAANLTTQVRNIAEVTTAVAGGDLSKKITVDVRGEILQLKETINVMVDQLNGFAGEVTRVAREVGTEGKLGGQAQVPGVAGTWKDLTDNVNLLAANLTTQVRNIAEVTTAVAGGDLSKKITVDVSGEVLRLKETINTMVDQLNGFAGEVTRVAREVGTEGKLGGQAQVPGVAGTWKDLTDNVNSMATNLTSQVRAIAEVATAVTKGDLTRSIQVDALGELAELKDKLNTMIDNLRLTTERNTEQDWLKTNLARFTNMLQGQRDLGTVGRLMLSELAPLVEAHQAVIYQTENDQEGETRLRLLSVYADSGAGHPETIRINEGLIGQCAADRRQILISDMPTTLHPISSGLFEATPKSIIVLPVLFEGQVKAVIELASLGHFTELQTAFLEQLTASIGIVLNSIEATMQTEGLLEQSQKLASELQTQQGELQQTNEQLEQKAAAARRAQLRGRAQEPGDRAGPPRGRGEGLGAGAHLALQVGVPGQHEPRAAHAPELDPDPGPAARRQSRGQPRPQADRVRPHHPRRRHRPPEPDQRHPRSQQDRIGHGDGRRRGDLLLQRAGDGGAAVPPPGRIAGPVVRRPARRQSRPQHRDRFQAPAADPEEPAVERAEVHRPGQRQAARRAGADRLALGQHGAQPGELGGRLRGHRHRRRHSGREAEDRVRGLPAGRRQHQPQVRRHRPRPRHQPRALDAAGRRADLAQHAGHRQHLHPLPADHVYRPAHGVARAAAGQPAAAAGGAARAPGRPVPRRPPQHPARRALAADRRGRSQLRRHPGRRGPRRRPEGRRDGARRGGARPCAAVQAGRHVARHLPARHAGLERAQPVQAHARDAAHPGADPQHGRGPPAGPGARRLLLPQQADDDRGAERRAVAHQRLRAAAQEAAADRRGQRGRAVRRQRASGPSRYRDRHGRFGPRARSTSCASSASTAWCSTCACPTSRASRCWRRSRRTRRWPTCRSWCSPAAT